METKLANRTRCCRGKNVKFTVCTKGQTIQLVFKAGHQVFSSRSLALAPSIVAMLLRKAPIMTGAKKAWSQKTRAAVSTRRLAKLTLRARNPNQVVATGPKTQPPYRAILPVRVRSWFLSPRFSTSCCAVMSPVANRTAVVTLCVSKGRAARRPLYLTLLVSRAW